MSPVNSVDSGTLSPTQQKLARPHPPRLQHSPSLPNIWFPPHSGPIPPQLNTMSRDSFHLLSTSSGKPDSSSPQTNQDSDQGKAEHKSSCVSFLEQASKKKSQPRPNVKIAGYKPGRRQRVENEPHKLLTPPLTPSSSIMTTASTESTSTSDGAAGDSQSGDHLARVTGGDDQVCPTRFLLVGNISPDVSQEVVKNAISTTLTATNLMRYRVDSILPTPITPSTEGTLSNLQTSATRTSSNHARQDNPIKGLFLRSRPDSGIIYLAFHDLRDAKAAKNYFDHRGSDVFDTCVGGGVKDTTDERKLSCTYLTTAEITQTLGNSHFLKTMNASFDISAEEEVDDAMQDLKIDDDEESEVGSRKDNMLKIYLSAQDIVSLTEITPSSDHPASKNSRKMFHVEYYDIRDASSAYKDMNNRVFFGLKVTVSGREDLAENTEHVDSDYIKAKSTDSIDSATTAPVEPIIPFPISRGDDSTPIGPPGQHSQIRQSFQYRSGSPQVFYNSRGVDTLSATSVGPREGDDVDPQRTPYANPQHRLVQGYYNPSYQFSGQDGTAAPVIGHPYYAPTPTPPPMAYGYLSPPPRFAVPPVHHTSPGGMPPYEHEMMWSTEMVNGAMPGYTAGYHVGAPPGHEYWAQGVSPTTFPSGGTSFFPPGLPGLPCVPGIPPFFVPPPRDGNEPQLSSPDLHVPEVSPLRHRGSSSSPPHLARNSITNKKETSENNQLNLAKIEDGLDTRTTIMIKNIPNKMTDKDLLSYIGKVVPRRIDFLYLRMDFKNGCNVGYAFVNFINVQDLLLFARSRLGQKWNMFSSEKVLQMSYANYQGKEALVEKFKNSCIMDEREAWQPKIFYSEPGPQQGLLEPFPAATHQRRKERSSHNRGALYVPGNSTLQTQNLLHTSFSRRLEYNESRPRERNHRRQRTTTTEE